MTTPPIIKPKPPAVPVMMKTSKKCCALYDFQAEQDGDLEFVTGDLIICTKTDGEWWEGRNVRTNKTGTFPANYTKMIE
jgi:amphiphysin